MDVAISNKLFLCFLIALAVFAITAVIIGPERKAKWFKKRSKYSFFNRRGFISEFIHYGYPCTIQGGAVALGMFGIISICSYLVFYW